VADSWPRATATCTIITTLVANSTADNTKHTTATNNKVVSPVTDAPIVKAVLANTHATSSAVRTATMLRWLAAAVIIAHNKRPLMIANSALIRRAVGTKLVPRGEARG